MIKFPCVGQKVKLSREGYQALHLDSAEAHEAAKCLVITEVENMAYNGAPPIWAIEVDNSLINMFMLDHTMFDPL